MCFYWHRWNVRNEIALKYAVINVDRDINRNVIDLDGMIVKAGDKIQQKFSSNHQLLSGFVNASLLFCVVAWPSLVQSKTD